jgi:diguanylate cyclase (GGDEF)-like protein
MRTGFISTAIMWGATINMVGILTGLSWSLAFCLCISGVVGAISLSSLAPDYAQGVFQQVFRTTCDIAAILLAEGAFSQKWPVVLVCVLFALYAVRQGISEHATYWRTMRDSRALEELQSMGAELENCQSNDQAKSVMEGKLKELVRVDNISLQAQPADGEITGLSPTCTVPSETLHLRGLQLQVWREAPLSDQERTICHSFLSEISYNLSRREMLERLKRNARIDGLTEVANRAYFLERATHTLNSNRRLSEKLGQPVTVAVLMLDIDHFKQVNDRYGHAAGDQVLKAVARRCQSSLREVDLLARYGGEEFCALVAGSDQEEAAKNSAERIRVAIAASPIEAEGHSVSVTISIGVAQVGPKEDIESALKRADKALYQAKQAGRNQVMKA